MRSYIEYSKNASQISCHKFKIDPNNLIELKIQENIIKIVWLNGMNAYTRLIRMLAHNKYSIIFIFHPQQIEINIV